MATMHTTDNNGNQVSLNLEHVVFTMPSGKVCCNGKMFELTAADVNRINGYIDRKTARIEAGGRAEKANKLAAAGRSLRLRADAGFPLVRAGGGSLHELREDVFDAASNMVRFGQYDAAMMGGEPFAVWN